MSVEKTKEYFKRWNMEDKVIEFDVSSATVDLAAKAIGCEAKRIAKTLSFMIDDKAILILVAGDAKIDNPKYNAQFSTKAKMIKADRVRELIGYDIGGVCPFGINEGVEVYLDKSLKRFHTVYPACGSTNSVIELTIEELEKYSNYSSWVDVAKGWE